MKIKVKLTKKEQKELRKTQAVIAKKAKAPDFDKTIPEAERTVDSWKI